MKEEGARGEGAPRVEGNAREETRDGTAEISRAEGRACVRACAPKHDHMSMNYYHVLTQKFT